MLGDHRGVDSSAYIEPTLDAHETGAACADQIVQNAVGHGFMKCSLVAEGSDIKFERFQFDTRLVRKILDENRGEVRLPGLRAQARKLWNFYMNCVISIRLWIIESFEYGVRHKWLFGNVQ